MRERVQKTELDGPLELATSTLLITGEPPYITPSLYGTEDSCWTVESHRCWDETHPGPPYRSGGPCDIRHFSTDYYEGTEVSEIYNPGGYIERRLEGKLLGAFKPSEYLDWTSVLDPILDDDQWCNPNWYDDGVKGWNRAKPAEPIVDLSVAIGEAREIPSMLAQTAKSFAKAWKRAGGKAGPFGPSDLADDWLNFNFGWRPFLNDLDGLITGLMNYQNLVFQLRKDNNQWKYRRRTVRKEASNEVVYENNNVPGHQPTGSTHLYNYPLGNMRIEKRTTLNSWFVGRFKYYIPYLKTSGAPSLRELAYIMGLNPSPITLYELMPWSWLIDWVTQAGNSFENLQAMISAGVIAKYAYVMSHKKQQVTAEYYSNFKGKPISSMATATAEQKVRHAASPFGVDKYATDFTDYQWSILGAIGISKNRVLSR